MGFISAAQSIDWSRAMWTILILIPYIDKEVVAVIPWARDVVPDVAPIYLTRITWTERARYLVLLLVPYLDGELLELVGVDYTEVIAD